VPPGQSWGAFFGRNGAALAFLPVHVGIQLPNSLRHMHMGGMHVTCAGLVGNDGDMPLCVSLLSLLHFDIA